MSKSIRSKIFILLILASCRPAPSATQGAAPAWPEVVLTDGAKVKVEVVATAEERALGLMFRESMPADHGMLFIFETPEFQTFYMKNCFFPQDMVFLDEKGGVVDVKENFEPCRAEPCPTYTSKGKALYVLELNAGQAKKHGIMIGSTLKLPKQ